MLAVADAFMRLNGRSQPLPEGATLFRIGDPVRSMSIVEAGELRLERHLPSGSALTMQVARPGAIVAEASLFASEYHCDAVVTAPSRVLAVGRAEVEQALSQDHEFARAWSRHSPEKIQRMRAQVEIVSLKTVSERLDAWLALSGSDLPPKGEWRRLASEMAVTPEALYRELGHRRACSSRGVQPADRAAAKSR